MIEPNADKAALDLRCPTCKGTGHVFSAFADDHACPTCHGTGRRDVVVVDAKAWREAVG